MPSKQSGHCPTTSDWAFQAVRFDYVRLAKPILQIVRGIQDSFGGQHLTARNMGQVRSILLLTVEATNVVTVCAGQLREPCLSNFGVSVDGRELLPQPGRSAKNRMLLAAVRRRENASRRVVRHNTPRTPPDSRPIHPHESRRNCGDRESHRPFGPASAPRNRGLRQPLRFRSASPDLRGHGFRWRLSRSPQGIAPPTTTDAR